MKGWKRKEKRMDNQLRLCQLRQLSIAKEIQRICKKHKIIFF